MSQLTQLTERGTSTFEHICLHNHEHTETVCILNAGNLHGHVEVQHIIYNAVILLLLLSLYSVVSTYYYILMIIIKSVYITPIYLDGVHSQKLPWHRAV